jgi:acyl-CoA dehydrogenase
MHSHVVAVAAWRWTHQSAPTDGLLRRIASENLIMASSGGSDWLDSGGTAVRVDGGFEITARKGFSSGSPQADLLATSAVYDDPDAGPTVLHFALPLKGDGVRHLATWKVMGMRGTGSNDVEIERLFVPDSGIVGRRPKGPWHMLFHVISKIAFALIYSAYLGVADGARANAVAAAAKRPQGKLLAVQAGEMDNALLSAELAWARMVAIAETADPGPATTAMAMACRTLVARNAIAAVEKALEVAGGGAFYRSNRLEQAFRDVQAARFHPLQEKPQQELSGRVALGWDIDG